MVEPIMELKSGIDFIEKVSLRNFPFPVHSSYLAVYEKLQKWSARFPDATDVNALFIDLFLLYLSGTKKFLDHRNSSHLFRLALSIHLTKKKLLHASAISSHKRHVEVRWLPTDLTFTFSFKRVLGCLIGLNVMDRYELFDEENILLTLQKHLPELRFVADSSYCHTLQQKNLKIFYLEIEKKNGYSFSLEEQILLKTVLDEKIKNSIQRLSPTAYMTHNVEETYKNILILSQELQTLQDLPQAYITLEQQTGKEIVFHVTLVYVSPFHSFSLKNYFTNCTFTSERMLTVRLLNNHPIEAHIFRLYFAREASFLRSDGSLDFYSVRQKVASLIKEAIGEFRDYNGGIIITQQELLHSFKEAFPHIAKHDPELMENFFYNLVPLENQALISLTTLSTLFKCFLEHCKQKLSKDASYVLTTHQKDNQQFLIIQGDGPSLTETISKVVQKQDFQTQDIVYNHITTKEGVFFNCVLQNNARNIEPFIQELQNALEARHQKLKNQQVLRIGLEFTQLFLDPRTGGETIHTEILRLLFEGLTRFNQEGEIENAIAESIEISKDFKEYTFYLRPSLWNDGSPLLAHDFEYAWKKILSPDFKTPFASLFYQIKNAKEAKEGKVRADQIGISALNDRTLKVELVYPTPYFLQLTAHPLYSPVHRLIDQQRPQWPYQNESNYPCNGPFQLKVNQPQTFVLVKNNNYWDAQEIVLDQITMMFMNSMQAYQAFQKKEIDWIGNPYGVWDPCYKPEADDRVVSFSTRLVLWNVFNTTYAPFHSRKVRQAFAYAIDRAKIDIDANFATTPAYSIHPNSLDSNRTLYPECDFEKARQLLHEGLQELGLNHKDLPTISLIFHEKGSVKHIVPFLRKQFETHLGIRCELTPCPWGDFFHRMTHGDYHIGFIHWMTHLNDPVYTLNAFKSANQGINFAKWEHPDFQHLLNLSEQEINQTRRFSLLFEAEKLLSEEMPIIPVVYHPYRALIRKDLSISNKSFFNIAKAFYKQKLFQYCKSLDKEK